MAISTSSVQSTQALIPSVSQPKENDSRSLHIVKMAVPIIIALASFLLLSAEVALAITAVVTIASAAYAMRTDKKPSPQPAAAVEPNTVAADPSPPQEIIFMSAKPNEKCDINKAEYMTVVFKTKEIAKKFYQNHRKKFRSGGSYDLDKRIKINAGRKQTMQEQVDILQKIYGHEGSVSLLCPISFAHLPQPPSAIEPSTVAAAPSRPQEIIFMSAKRNDTCDINKAECMTVFFKTEQDGLQFFVKHLLKFPGLHYSREPSPRVAIPAELQPMQKSVDTLKEIYGHEGSVSLLCPTSFTHYQK